jgi:hypothetical protein
MQNFYRVGVVSILAFVFGGAAANAQFTGAPPGGEPTGQDFKGKIPDTDERDRQLGELVAKKAAPAPPPRTSKFNRVTTTRKQVVPSPGASASRGGSPSSGIAAGSRPAAMRPFTPKAANERAKATPSGIPTDSTWRQTPRPASPPATSLKSVTRNYYPGLRPGAHPNADRAQTRARNGRSSALGGIGVGLGMSGGAKSAPAARPGQSAIPAHGAAAPRR